jgi:hypothetical protein
MENEIGYEPCGMEEVSLDYIEAINLTHLCDSVSQAEFIFSYDVCDRCPGRACIPEHTAHFIITDDTQVLMVYKPSWGRLINNGEESERTVKFCKP